MGTKGKTRTEEDLKLARSIGLEIYIRRKERGFSVQRLALAAKVSRDTICEIEAGRRIGNVITIYRIARVLHCDISAFFGTIRGAECVRF